MLDLVDAGTSAKLGPAFAQTFFCKLPEVVAVTLPSQSPRPLQGPYSFT